MGRLKLTALLAALVIAFAPAAPAQTSRADIEVLIAYYAQYYGVPVELVRRVVQRESSFNPSARNGPYWGLMQILPQTARTMGFRGQPSDLLDAETNLIYAVKYLRGAYLVAGGNQDRAVQLYARGYYYDAKAKGLLEETGLRPGPASPVAPPPPTAVAAAAPVPAPQPQPLPQFEPAVVAAIAPAEPQVQPLGFLPPRRPEGLEARPENAALEAIAAQAPQTTGDAQPQEPDLGASIQSASAFMNRNGAQGLRPSQDMFEGTFSMLEAMSGAVPASAPTD